MWRVAICLLLLSCAHAAPAPTAPAETTARRFVVYSLWLRGDGEVHREELDLFQQCLLRDSNFAEFWSGQITIEPGGSWVVAPPEGQLGRGSDAETWLGPMLAGVPPVEEGVTPIYLVYAHAKRMRPPVCGYCGVTSLAGRDALLAVVRTEPPCWPAQGTVRGLTQFAMHEISCAIELALGEDHCAADGQCEARSECPNPCDTFTGLSCPGAPETSYTGCDGTPVSGWVVQRLSHKGQGTSQCPLCAPCDFTVRRKR